MCERRRTQALYTITVGLNMSYERKSCPVKSLPLIIVDLTSPVVVCRRKQATISVTARGHPRPCVTWLVGRNRKPISATTAGDKYFRCEENGDGRHSLIVSSVGGVLDDGVWVVASNDVGEDKCFIDVKTYRGRSRLILFHTR